VIVCQEPRCKYTLSSMSISTLCEVLIFGAMNVPGRAFVTNSRASKGIDGALKISNNEPDWMNNSTPSVVVVVCLFVCLRLSSVLSLQSSLLQIED